MTAVTKKDKFYLRDLAKRIQEYSSLPEMKEKEHVWYDLNMGRDTIPPVVVETETFHQIFIPERILRCVSTEARKMEYRLLKTIREYELIHDDKVISDTYPISYRVSIDEFGFPIEEFHALDPNGRNVGYQYHSPIHNLEEDFWMLKPSKLIIDHESSLRAKNFAQEILGDILTVEMSGIPPIIAMPWQVSKLLGLEGMMTALYDCPETMHRLMSYLTENQIRIMKEYELQGILTLNNGNQETCMSSFGFTKELPVQKNSSISLKDIWMWAEAEETASISPEMFQEFFLPYIAQAASLAGLIYYGCCEPMHLIWKDLIKAIPNIRKVSISPWSDEEKMGEFLRGTGIVYSRKPLANFLSIGDTFDESAWRRHIQGTLQAAKGCQCEFIMRDIYQTSDLNHIRKAVQIAKQEALYHLG